MAATLAIKETPTTGARFLALFVVLAAACRSSGAYANHSIPARGTLDSTRAVALAATVIRQATPYGTNLVVTSFASDSTSFHFTLGPNPNVPLLVINGIPS